MANAFDVWRAQLPIWEGGYVNHPNDRGGPTNAGVTLGTWNQYAARNGWQQGVEGLKRMNPSQYATIIHSFWDLSGAGKMRSEAVAFLLAEGFWGGGYYELMAHQRAFNRAFGGNLVVDGAIGPKSVEAFNSVDQKRLYQVLDKSRRQYYDAVAQQPNQSVFRAGWFNRINKGASIIEANNWIGAAAAAGGGLLILGLIVYGAWKRSRQ